MSITNKVLASYNAARRKKISHKNFIPSKTFSKFRTIDDGKLFVVDNKIHIYDTPTLTQEYHVDIHPMILVAIKYQYFAFTKFFHNTLICIYDISTEDFEAIQTTYGVEDILSFDKYIIFACNNSIQCYDIESKLCLFTIERENSPGYFKRIQFGNHENELIVNFVYYEPNLGGVMFS
jgi:WD40 repeat protein